MRKEVFFAVLVGGLIGVVIAFGFWRANSALDTTQEVVIQPETDQTATEISLTVAKPSDTAVISTSTISVTGLTSPSSIVIVSAERQDYITQSSTQGEFEQEIDLVGGINEIIVSAFDGQGQSVEEKILLVYSTELEKK